MSLIRLPKKYFLFEGYIFEFFFLSNTMKMEVGEWNCLIYNMTQNNTTIWPLTQNTNLSLKKCRQN